MSHPGSGKEEGERGGGTYAEDYKNQVLGLPQEEEKAEKGKREWLRRKSPQHKKEENVLRRCNSSREEPIVGLKMRGKETTRSGVAMVIHRRGARVMK